MRTTTFLAGACCLISLLAAGPASKPVMGPDTSIAGDQYHFPAPPVDDWSAVQPDPAGNFINFLDTNRDGQIQLSLLPSDASVDPPFAAKAAAVIVKTLKDDHAKKHLVMVMQPTIEKDRRFPILIHEKYKVGDFVADELHAYKAVGPRVLMMTVNTIAADPDRVAAIHNAGLEMLDAARFNRKAFKKDPND